jgi:hypothetical protein
MWTALITRDFEALVSSPDEIKHLYHRCRNGYEKLQVFRLLELDQDHPVIRKFVNETYHIENEFICQLDPSRFDLIRSTLLRNVTIYNRPATGSKPELGFSYRLIHCFYRHNFGRETFAP